MVISMEPQYWLGGGAYTCICIDGHVIDVDLAHHESRLYTEIESPVKAVSYLPMG